MKCNWLVVSIYGEGFLCAERPTFEGESVALTGCLVTARGWWHGLEARGYLLPARNVRLVQFVQAEPGGPIPDAIHYAWRNPPFAQPLESRRPESVPGEVLASLLRYLRRVMVGAKLTATEWTITGSVAQLALRFDNNQTIYARYSDGAELLSDTAASFWTHMRGAVISEIRYEPAPAHRITLLFDNRWAFSIPVLALSHGPTTASNAPPPERMP